MKKYICMQFGVAVEDSPPRLLAQYIRKYCDVWRKLKPRGGRNDVNAKKGGRIARES